MKKQTLRPTAFILSATNHGTMLINRHDYRMTSVDHGYGVGFQILNRSAFDPEEVDVVLDLLETRRKYFGDGLFTIDCGANLGVHTIEWAQYMHGWGEVIAFEAQERIFYALAGNITMNNCFNARAIWAAVGKVNGTINVPIPNYFQPSSFGSLEIRKTERTEFIGQEINYVESNMQSTQMLTIDSLNLSRLDFIKIDIEGMEVDALQGARQSIVKFKPYMLIEKIKSNEQELLSFLNEMGYRTIPLGINLLAIHQSDPVNAEINLS